MRDVLEKVVKRKLGVRDPVIMQGSSLLYETGEDLEEDMAAHYASLLDKVHMLEIMLPLPVKLLFGSYAVSLCYCWRLDAFSAQVGEWKLIQSGCSFCYGILGCFSDSKVGWMGWSRNW